MMLVIFAFMSLVVFAPTRPGDPGPPFAFFGFFFAIMFIFQMAFTVPSFIAAYALLKKKPWARMATIVAGVLSAINVPIGTAACIYGFWFFMGDNWKSIYPEKAEQVQGNPRQIPYGVESQQAAYEEEGKKEEKTFDPYDPPDWR